MNNSNKRIAKNSIVLNIRLIITLIIGLYTSRVILRVLGVEDFGLYNLVGGFVALLSIITSSIVGAASRFITYSLGKGNVNDLSNTFSTIIIVLLGLSTFVAFLGGLIGPWFITTYLSIPDESIQTAIIVFICSLLVFVLNILAVPYTALVTAHENMSFYALMAIFDSICKLCIAIGLEHVSNVNLLCLYAMALTLTALVNRLIYGIYCNRKYKESKFQFKIDKSLVRQFFSYSFWLTLGTTFGIIKDQSGNIFQNVFFGLAMNAAMGIANQVKSIIVQFSGSIGMAISPQITKSYASGAIPESIKLTYLQTKCQGIVILLIAIPILSETNFLLTIWLQKVPEYAPAFVNLTILTCFFNSIGMGTAPLYLATGKIKNLQIVVCCISALYVPVCYVLLNMTYSPIICLSVGLAMEIVFMFAKGLYLNRIILFPIMDYTRRVIAPLIMSFALSFFTVFLFSSLMPCESFLRFILSLFISVAISLLLSYIWVLNKSERVLVVSTIRSKIKRIF